MRCCSRRHILPEVEATCDRALVISKGELVAEGSIDDLRKLSRSRGVRGDASHKAEAAEIADRGHGRGGPGGLGGRGGAFGDLEARDRRRRPSDGTDRRDRWSPRGAACASWCAPRPRSSRCSPSSPKRLRGERLLADLQARALLAVRHADGVGADRGLPRDPGLSLSTASCCTSRENAELSVDQGPVQAFFGESMLFYLPLILLCPGMTMRLFAEERRCGNHRDAAHRAGRTPRAIVLGKFAAALVTYVAMWLPTVLYIVVLRRAGEHRLARRGDQLPRGSCSSARATSPVGTLMSAMTQSQLVALDAVVAGHPRAIRGRHRRVHLRRRGRRTISAPTSRCGTRWASYRRGSSISGAWCFDGTLIALPLFVTVRAVDAWRWG